jgi:methionyl-tRNA formyltransferase
LRVAFAGSADFSLPSLRALVEAGHEVVLVLTAPDRLGDRGRPARRPVRDLAREMGLPVAQPARLAGPALAELESAKAELLVVCAYGQLLRQPALEAAPNGAWGVHPSLLPRHRGAAPIASAILAGDRSTGVTIYSMDERMDAGPILAQVELPLHPRATTPTLTDVLAAAGAELLLRTLEGYESGEVVPSPQDESRATYSHKLTRADAAISWSLPAVQIDRLVRALQPWPGAICELSGAAVKLLDGEPVPAGGEVAPPGSAIGAVGESVQVATGEGAYLVHLVQPPSARPMTPAAFLRGQRPRAHCR